MKNLYIILIMILFASNATYAQKVNISLGNPGVEAGYFKFDVIATVLPGQTWKVGSSNLRIDWSSVPSNGISVKTDNPVSGANSNLSGNSNYSAMTTTSISGGSAISLNITRLGNCHTLPPGQYVIGRIRFNRLDTTCTVTMTIRPNSVMQDSITQMINPADWTVTNPPPVGIVTGVELISSFIPKEYNLYQNYPNPFNPATRIKFDIPKQSFVSIKIYDMAGREIAKLVDEELAPASYEYSWNAGSMPSGVYFYRIQTADYINTMRMVLVK
jgi:hypothetical protein